MDQAVGIYKERLNLGAILPSKKTKDEIVVTPGMQDDNDESFDTDSSKTLSSTGTSEDDTSEIIEPSFEIVAIVI